MIEGIFIPKEFYKVKELNGLERDILALYKYYTENGKYKCCSLTNKQITDDLSISTRYLNKVKKHLKELGFIRTDGGIKVTYIGINVGTTVPEMGTTVPEMGTTVPDGLNYSSQNQELQIGHKKIKKEKEDKKEKKGVSNFDLLLEHLPSDYKTQERIDYIEDKYKERINDTDLTDGIIDSWVINIKNELNKTFPINYVIPKQEKKVDFIDVF